MDMTAEQVIGRTVKNLAGTNSSDETFNAYAGVILADLEAAGYAVVALPEPQEDGYGNKQFGNGLVIAFPDGFTQLRLEDHQFDDCTDWSPDSLRSFAADLLAAAAEAEK